MTDETKRDPAVKQAKAAAREVIGKLIGDDAEVREGQRQKAAAAKATNRKNQQQE